MPTEHIRNENDDLVKERKNTGYSELSSDREHYPTFNSTLSYHCNEHYQNH